MYVIPVLYTVVSYSTGAQTYEILFIIYHKILCKHEKNKVLTRSQKFLNQHYPGMFQDVGGLGSI